MKILSGRRFFSGRVFLAVLCCFAVFAPLRATDDNASYLAALESITAEDLSGSVNYLADDTREGREAGTRGGYAAGEFLIAQLKELGAHPAGANQDFVQYFPPNFRNILGEIEGSDPLLKDEVILIGAHYDHVGYGTSRNSLGPIGYIHNGADDNASGTSGVLQLARAFARLPTHPKRTLLFVFWDAEEKGLLGSKYWVAHPTLPLQRLVLAVNADMIGRLRDEHLILFGTRTAPGLRQLVSRANQRYGLQLEFSWLLKPNADHFTFVSAGIPVLMFHTGEHENYHRPSDKAHLINTSGMSSVTRLAFESVYRLAEMPTVPAFREASREESPEVEQTMLAQSPPPGRFGVSWNDPEQKGKGIVVSEVAADSPAQRAGVQPGDRIVRFDGREIQVSSDFLNAVRLAESPAKLTIQRPGEETPQELTAQLLGSPMKLGVYWRVDDAEPGAIIVTYVLPDSPAAKAGLRMGDRIYQVAGKSIPDEAAFAQWFRQVPPSLELMVEREGRIRRMTVEFQPPAFQRAA